MFAETACHRGCEDREQREERHFGPEIAPYASETDPVERLVKAGTAYVKFALAHPDEFRVMFRPELFGKTARDAADTSACDAYSVLTEAIAACLATGAVTGDASTLVMAGLEHGAWFRHAYARQPGRRAAFAATG